MASALFLIRFQTKPAQLKKDFLSDLSAPAPVLQGLRLMVLSLHNLRKQLDHRWVKETPRFHH
jgi:hypothetical protein